MSLDTPWDRAAKTKSERQEEKISKLPGGGKQVNSGRSTWTSKRDNTLGRVFRFLVEARTTDKDSFTFKKREFLDLRKQAFQTPPGLLPMMQIDMGELELALVQLKEIHEMEARMLDLEERLNATVSEDSEIT